MILGTIIILTVTMIFLLSGLAAFWTLEMRAVAGWSPAKVFAGSLLIAICASAAAVNAIRSFTADAPPIQEQPVQAVGALHLGVQGPSQSSASIMAQRSLA